MKQLRFTGVVRTYEGEVENPVAFVEMALKYGDKHQDFISYSVGEVTVEDVEDDE